MKKTLVLAAVVAVAVVAMNGVGLHAMGLRHSGAHILVEFVSAFVVTLAVGFASALHAAYVARTTKTATVDAWTAPSRPAAPVAQPVADRIAASGAEVDPDAGTTAWTSKSSGARS